MSRAPRHLTDPSGSAPQYRCQANLTGPSHATDTPGVLTSSALETRPLSTQRTAPPFPRVPNHEPVLPRNVQLQVDEGAGGGSSPAGPLPAV